MKTQSPTRVVLILIGALVLTGCALKPKRASRFHQTTANGSCNCYTCQNSPGASNVVMQSQPTTGAWVESSEFVSTPMGSATKSFPSTEFSSSQFSDQPREPYQMPDEPTAPVVSSEPFTTNSPSFAAEQPVIEEVEPGFKSGGFELSDTTEDSLGGGSFKPLNKEEFVAAPRIEEPVVDTSKPLTVESLNDVEPLSTAATLKTTEPTPTTKLPSVDDVAPGPIEMAKPAEIVKPVEVPTPAEVTKAIEIPKPAAEIPSPIAIPKKIEIPKEIAVPAPASTFKPGETFKPRKKIKPLDTSMFGGESFDQTQFENSPSDQSVALTAQPDEHNQSIDSFFGRQSTEARPLPQQNMNGKVVLRANPVERNVVYCPPSKNASKVLVPALEAGFRKQNTAGNWLRSVANERPAPTRTASVEANVTEVVAAARPEAAPAVLQTPPAVESTPRRLAVKLRAIPMNDEMIRGQRVNVRFREHQPTQRDSQNVIVESPVPAQRQQAIAQPLMEAVAAPSVTLNPKVELLEIDMPAEQPVMDRTARSSDAVVETATPPWRLK